MPVRLLLRFLLSHKLRTALTALSVAVALFLLCVLDAANRGLDASLASASRTRLWVMSAVSLYVTLPESYAAKIRTVPGVEEIIRFQWFGGVYRDQSNFHAQFAVDADKFLASYPETELLEGSLADWQAGRTNCIIGVDLADRFGWKVGDKIQLIGTIFPRTDGAAWDFTVAGIYRSNSPNIDQASNFFHYEYLYETREQGEAGGPDGVGTYLVQLEESANRDEVMTGIEGFYENGPQRVRAITEAEFQRQFISMLGSVPTLLASIGGSVLFAIFFAVLNTMLMAGRERTRDIGILKALGFANGRIAMLLMTEALLLCLLGGGLGVGLALLAEKSLWSLVIQFNIPGFAISGAVIAKGMVLAGLLGLVAGALPAWRANRMHPVAALRAEV